MCWSAANALAAVLLTVISISFQPLRAASVMSIRYGGSS
jgi:hypothetical protein